MEQITTVTIPLNPTKNQEKILFESIDQATWIAEKAAILLPGFQQAEGQVLIARKSNPKKGIQKGDVRTKTVKDPDTKEKKEVPLLTKSGVENIDRTHLYHVVRTIKKKWGLPKHLGNEVCRDIVMNVHISFKSSSENWISKLWRTSPSRLIFQYNLWGWFIPQFESAATELLGKAVWDSTDFENGEELSEAGIACGIVDKVDIINEIQERKGKKIHRSNRPRFGAMKPHRYRGDKYPIPLNGTQCVKFNPTNVWIKLAGGLDINLGKTKPRNRKRLLEIIGPEPLLYAYWAREESFNALFEVVQEDIDRSHWQYLKDTIGLKEQYEWSDDILLYLSNGGKNGECKIVLEGDRFYLHVPINNQIQEKWDPKLPTYYVGIHQGIYRPFTIVIINELGNIIYKKVVRGQEAIHNWFVMDCKYAYYQAQARDCHKWYPLKDSEVAPNHHIVAEGWLNKGGKLIRQINPGKKPKKTWVWGRYHRRDLSKKEVRSRYSRAAGILTRRTNQLHDFLHCKIKEVTAELEDWPANFVVFIHDYTFVRDGHMKKDVLWGPDRDDLPKYLRRLGSLWPFLKTKGWLLERLNRTGRVKSYPIPLTISCTRCSSCGALAGTHGNVDDIPFFEHYSHNFCCSVCKKMLNADINAACNAAWLASQWGGKGDPSKWVREVGVTPSQIDTYRKRGIKSGKNVGGVKTNKSMPPLAEASRKRK